MEKLKNVHLLQQLDHHKQLVESYQKQIEQLSKSLDKANASIQDFAQTKLLEMRSSLPPKDLSDRPTSVGTKDNDKNHKPPNPSFPKNKMKAKLPWWKW